MANALREDNRVTGILARSNLVQSSLLVLEGLPLAGANALVVAVVDSTGTQISTFPVSGTVTANQGGAPWSQNITQVGGALFSLGQQLAAGSLPIVLTASQLTTLTPLSSVTANAGTNLNTSLLALESGGNLAMIAGAITASVVQSNVKQINGVAPSMGAGASGTGVQRVVQANDSGKTLTSKGGSVSSSGNNTLISAGTNRLKIHAFSLSTTSTTAVICIFQSGASGTELWRVILQAPSGVSTGANLAITPPAWLFATASATLLNLNLDSSQTIHYSVSYVDEV